MPKIILNIPDEEYNLLKQKAKEDERSLTKYLQRVLRFYANGTLLTQNQVNQVNSNPASQASPASPVNQVNQVNQVNRDPFNLSQSQSQATTSVTTSVQDNLIADIVKSGGIVRMPKLTKKEQEDKAFHEKIETQSHLDREHNLWDILDTFKANGDEDNHNRTKFAIMESHIIFDLIEEDLDKTHTLEEIIAHLKNLYNRYYTTEDDDDDYSNSDDESEEYLYQREIEMREKKLIINLSENDIYKKIKKYCLEHEMYEVFYRLIEYPAIHPDVLKYENDANDKFIYCALGTPLDGSHIYSEQEWEFIVEALQWEED